MIAKDYYLFGMEQPNRSFSSNSYRYGFNGMEKDDEVSGNGNSYTTEYRAYDPRIGRWKSSDRLAPAFPWQSPYVSFDNNPVYFNDPLGLAAEGGPDFPSHKDSKKGDTMSHTNEKDFTWNYTYEGRRKGWVITSGSYDIGEATIKPTAEQMDDRPNMFARKWNQFVNWFVTTGNRSNTIKGGIQHTTTNGGTEGGPPLRIENGSDLDNVNVENGYVPGEIGVSGGGASRGFTAFELAKLLNYFAEESTSPMLGPVVTDEQVVEQVVEATVETMTPDSGWVTFSYHSTNIDHDGLSHSGNSYEDSIFMSLQDTVGVESLPSTKPWYDNNGTTTTPKPWSYHYSRRKLKK